MNSNGRHESLWLLVKTQREREKQKETARRPEFLLWAELTQKNDGKKKNGMLNKESHLFPSGKESLYK